MHRPAHRPAQANKWYSSDEFRTTETEALVLALLLDSFHDQERVSKWALEVIADSPMYEIGAPWLDKPAWTSTKQHIASEFKAFVGKDKRLERRRAVAHAVGLYDGAGHVDGLCDHQIGNYLTALLAPADKALLGVAANGAVTAKKGAPLRRTYILPRVARLLVERSTQLKVALAAGYDGVFDTGRAAGSHKAVHSAQKPELKRQLAEQQKKITELSDDKRKEVRNAAHARRAPRSPLALVLVCGVHNVGSAIGDALPSVRMGAQVSAVFLG